MTTARQANLCAKCSPIFMVPCRGRVFCDGCGKSCFTVVPAVLPEPVSESSPRRSPRQGSKEDSRDSVVNVPIQKNSYYRETATKAPPVPSLPRGPSQAISPSAPSSTLTIPPGTSSASSKLTKSHYRPRVLQGRPSLGTGRFKISLPAPTESVAADSQPSSEVLLERYVKGEIPIRSGANGRWELQCNQCLQWVNTGIIIAVSSLQYAGHFTSLGSHMGGKKCSLAASLRSALTVLPQDDPPLPTPARLKSANGPDSTGRRKAIRLPLVNSASGPPPDTPTIEYQTLNLLLADLNRLLRQPHAEQPFNFEGTCSIVSDPVIVYSARVQQVAWEVIWQTVLAFDIHNLSITHTNHGIAGTRIHAAAIWMGGPLRPGISPPCPCLHCEHQLTIIVREDIRKRHMMRGERIHLGLRHLVT
ncbi:hypothetical protein B0H16DRAFT_1499636 [Mycena metata]|uniref:Uncharacterized protein n=1 Tax=Mycena metata TaxID=1033252 RepID=A0AAD7K711_9AGAR|nr:hypothetical protein B0H16DRAFT_1499636 [Mycena metata]